MDLNRLKKLAGVENLPNDDSMGENLSLIGTKKAEYQRKHNVQPCLLYTSPSPRDS